MTKKEIERLVHTIGEYLSANHGTIATDHPDASTTAISWEIDNTTALNALERLAAHLGVTVDDMQAGD